MKLAQSELINNNRIDILTIILVLIQVFISCFLFFEVKIKKTLIASFFFLLFVTLYLLALNEFSLFNGCSCGGIFDGLEYHQHVFVNLSIIFLNILLLILSKFEITV